MKIVQLTSDLQENLQIYREKGAVIGFVPTMGALHAGHMSLIKQAREMCDVVVASVFVNPTQFNNPEDLKLYPRTPEADAALLESNGCDIAFFPSVSEMYPEGWIKPAVDLAGLDLVLEGKFRPGHFEGVVEVVSRLFDLVKPDKAFFGMKDFQQVAVVKRMVHVLKLPVQVIPCQTERETAGLAMSSRNARLSEDQKLEALHIFRTMEVAKKLAADHTPGDTDMAAKAYFSQSGMELEYLEIVDPDTLKQLDEKWVPGAVVCIACYCGPVRLIDNMELIPK